MKTSTVTIQNLKCGGCANTVTNRLTELEGVKSVSVDVESSEVELSLEKEEDLKLVINRLAEIGYPIEGDENSLMQKAKSFVSCAVGRMN